MKRRLDEVSPTFDKKPRVLQPTSSQSTSTVDLEVEAGRTVLTEMDINSGQAFVAAADGTIIRERSMPADASSVPRHVAGSTVDSCDKDTEDMKDMFGEWDNSAFGEEEAFTGLDAGDFDGTVPLLFVPSFPR